MYPKRVIILASDPQLISALQDALTGASFEVEVALSEMVGTSILAERRMDAVILDTAISSGEENGLGDRLATMATSVVLLLGTKKPRKPFPKATNGMASQVFIQKPIDARSLIRELQALLKPKPAPQAARRRQRIKLSGGRRGASARESVIAAKKLRRQKRPVRARR